MVPETGHLFNMRLGGGGVDGDISAKFLAFAAHNLERCLLDAFLPLGSLHWPEPSKASSSEPDGDTYTGRAVLPCTENRVLPRFKPNQSNRTPAVGLV